MSNNENQCILVWCNRPDGLENMIRSAFAIARMLRKEVCLFANYQTKAEKVQCCSQIERMMKFSATINGSVSYRQLLVKGSLKEIAPFFTERYESILFCAPGKMDFALLNAFYQSRTPFFFNKGDAAQPNLFKRLIIPVDFRQSAKNSALWGSFFGRMNQSEVILVVPSDHDKDLLDKVKGNLVSIVRLYQSFNFPYRIEKRQCSSWNIHREAMKMAQQSDMYVFSGSYNVSLPDYLFGPFEKRMVNRSDQVAILLLNPQHETCVICD